jgi:hypothetical protein
MSTTPSRSFRDARPPSLAPEKLWDAEKRWVSLQPYLLSKGYELRPRYRPDWVPSWTLTGADPDDCEDSLNSLVSRLLTSQDISRSAH